MDCVNHSVQEDSVSLQDERTAKSAAVDPAPHKTTHRDEVPRKGTYIIVDHVESMDLGLLPEGWIRLRHVSGLTLYLHRLTRVVTLSRPYSLGSSSVRYHRVPVSALPCLAYRRACDQRSCKNEEPTEDLSKSEVETRGCLATPVHQQSATSPVEAQCPFSHKSAVTVLDKGLDETPDETPNLNSFNPEKEEGELSSGEEDDEFYSSAVPTKKIKLEQKVSKKQSTQEIPAEVIDPAPPSVKMPPINVSIVTEKTMSSTGKRRIRKRMSQANLRKYAVNAQNNQIESSTENKDTPPKPCSATGTGVKRLGNVKTQVFAVKDKESESLLTAEEIRTYCSRLFEIKFEESNNQRTGEQTEETTSTQEVSEPRSRFLMMPEEAKVIRYQLPPAEGDPARKQPKEGVINLTGKSFVCILHEYCQTVIRSPPTYQTVVLENEKNPYKLTVLIGGTPYATGVGRSKKQARLDAARNALSRLIPDFDKIVGSHNPTNGPAVASERDLQLFDGVSITDPRLYEMSVRMAFPTPHNCLVECLSRNCVPESDLKANMMSQGRSKHFFTLQLREHSIKVPCRNKREGRHLAAQHLLARLHPEITSWGGILRIYGPGTKPDKRGELETIQGAQNQEKSAVKTSLIRLLKTKMRELADQWEKGGQNIHPKGKFIVSADNLPVVTFHPDSQTDIYGSIPAPASPPPPTLSPSTKN
ncbi:Microprocessor complex subunit dgcr8 [Clonorchis sinensis]|uniref:Microprocessor complex subunit dgcr8 n=1 Tax=Clonorchis sinensis TaxID=79923 RepID=A0A8T1MSA3_CLOSI|nr:Microprocessor complex subunit dgcr8 [Clonorchis sinensis]